MLNAPTTQNSELVQQQASLGSCLRRPCMTDLKAHGHKLLLVQEATELRTCIHISTNKKSDTLIGNPSPLNPLGCI